LLPSPIRPPEQGFSLRFVRNHAIASQAAPPSRTWFFERDKFEEVLKHLPLAVSPANGPLRNLNQGEALPLEVGLLIYKYP